ncbi:cytochrome bd-I oxidase subunit CydX [Roseibium salinum]|uniref:Cytochrome bd-I oxidase subunit CydX n=1 Tax=Roseibium salinum TaxID=1604349 RepID=A0ABT3R1G4_9HYPH|nr:cytochrome bd-I oxidase subunit CydX [Roseibium sp. DSM 29163]MCX2723060.1 cytochrome bd-I oxidase subunit CydX [Roseibium sp. DSM 29163]MDN3719001.1 cytochrome bd-I oxidase subunit CydX [Roseibium salinum]
MWYFAWALGMPLACCLAILNAMWLEMRFDDESRGSGEKRSS